MIPGISAMLRLCAGSLDVAPPFHPHKVPTLVKAPGIFTWMMCSAEEMSAISGNALTGAGEAITVDIVKTLVSSVRVTSVFNFRVFLYSYFHFRIFSYILLYELAI